MERKPYDVLAEPRGATYRRLIDASRQYCDSFLLVDQPGWPLLNDRAHALLEALTPFLISKREAWDWPGTSIQGGDKAATIYSFRLVDESMRILKEGVEGLYDWDSPNCPSDLTLLRPDGTPWLVTIMPDREAFLELSLEELDLLKRENPAIVLVEAENEGS